jgi:hypothetical protein
MSAATLVLSHALSGHPAVPELEQRLQQRGAGCLRLDVPVTARVLLSGLRGADIARSWLATSDPADIGSAATAGLVGVVLVGVVGEDRDDGILVRHAPDLSGVTIAMVPRGGGCWHDGPAR